MSDQTTRTGEEALLREYYELFHAVDEFDKRLITVKGWGVTLSLAALAWGFQYHHFGLFLVAALGGLAFWLVEGAMKRHQMRYYLRMREIEVLRYERAPEGEDRALSSPRIDSSWSYAGELYAGKGGIGYSPQTIKGPKRSYRYIWLFPHVSFPHVVAVVAGLALLCLAYYGALGEMRW